MRNRNDFEPRLMALSEAELAATRRTRSWIPQGSDPSVAMSPARSWQRARQPESLSLWSAPAAIH
jgi:hypothetical protein